MMDYKALYKKYQALLEENKRLKAITASIKTLPNNSDLVIQKPSIQKQSHNSNTINQPILFEKNRQDYTEVSNTSPKEDKIALYMSLFKGRNDVYAKRWENKKGQSGYSPVCSNEWVFGICNKPKIKCSQCFNKSYSVLNAEVIEQHLLGEIVIGIYPMNLDETCSFLVMDFDKAGWQEDISVVRETCVQLEIPVAVERSRSGNGGHIWFFFKNETEATLARKFATSLLTRSMGKRHEIPFKSYDRLFPNQDTMPKGGFGNLIALPLQKAARQNSNSVFVDINFEPFADQWVFLSKIQKNAEDKLNLIIKKLVVKSELGLLKNFDEDIYKPWETKVAGLSSNNFPKEVEIAKSAMLYIKKEGLSQIALNTLQRFAAFRNPDFYKAQAMRLPTYNKPRIISCSEDFKTYLALPRGCEDDVNNFFKKHKIKQIWVDKTTKGKSIDVKFKGTLRRGQQDVVDALIKYNNGVLFATTAFGKTVVGAKLISIRKVNTLILVHRQQLLSQWKERLSEFLEINEVLPELPKKRGSKNKLGLIGQLGSGKKQLNFIIDVAIMQSVNSKGEINECMKNYGMVIVDECHHVPAFSFEQILRNTTARYIYGLTATPVRPDGHHPIIFFYCGPIRSQVDAKEQAGKRPFDHVLIPRFTSFKIAKDKKSEELSIQKIYSELINDEIRNQSIAEDIIECNKNGRNSLVLSGRVAHVKLLSKILLKQIPNVILLTGGMGVKKTKETLENLKSIPKNKPFVVVATGSFIGEGFDEPRLDTLFLTTPIAWKGTLQQYVGRLHRLYESKKEVQVFDYVDIYVRVLEKMYGKRLKGYASMGYKSKSEIAPASPTNLIFDKQSFFPVYLNDIAGTKQRLLIISPFVTKKRVEQMLPLFKTLIEKQVEIIIITRPVHDFVVSKTVTLQSTYSILEDVDTRLIFKSKIHQKFAIIDRKICWYGSINLLSFGWSEESIMRIVSGSIAYELERSVS